MRRVLFKFRFLSLVVLAMLAGVWPMVAQAASPTPPNVGAAGNFSVLANQPLTCTDTASPGVLVTGPAGVTFPVALPAVTLTGTNCQKMKVMQVAGATAPGPYADFLNVYSVLAPKPGDVCTSETGTLANVTLPPGVYCFSAAAVLTGVLTLKGPSSGIWIFKIGTGGTGALTGTSFTVVMAGGGNPCNAFWWVSQDVTFTDSVVKGTMLAGGDITLTRTALRGRAWAGGTSTPTAPKGAVTMTGPGTTIGGCAGAGTGTGNQCNPGGSKDKDKDSDKSKDAADSSAPVKSDTTGTSDNSQGDSKDDNGKHSNDNDKSDNDKKGCVTESSEKDKSDQSDKSTKSD